MEAFEERVKFVDAIKLTSASLFKTALGQSCAGSNVNYRVRSSRENLNPRLSLMISQCARPRFEIFPMKTERSPNVFILWLFVLFRGEKCLRLSQSDCVLYQVQTQAIQL